MPFIFRYKEFIIRFWYSFEERRRHVHTISDKANIKIWLEPEIEVASVKGQVNPSTLNEILKEIGIPSIFAKLFISFYLLKKK